MITFKFFGPLNGSIVFKWAPKPAAGNYSISLTKSKRTSERNNIVWKIVPDCAPPRQSALLFQQACIKLFFFPTEFLIKLWKKQSYQTWWVFVQLGHLISPLLSWALSNSNRQFSSELGPHRLWPHSRILEQFERWTFDWNGIDIETWILGFSISW